MRTKSVNQWLRDIKPWWQIPPFSPRQLKAARGALGWGLRETARRGNTTPGTLCKFEQGKGVHRSVLEPVRKALEAEGIVFVDATKGRGESVVFGTRS